MLGIALTMYGREEQADTIIEQLLRDKVRTSPLFALSCPDLPLFSHLIP